MKGRLTINAVYVTIVDGTVLGERWEVDVHEGLNAIKDIECNDYNKRRFMMDKFFKYFILTVLAIGLMSGSAFAGVITVPNAFTTAAEGMPVTCASNLTLTTAGGNVTPLGNSLGSAIVYTPGIAMIDGDKITFTLTNGTFRDTNYYLIVWEGQAGVGDLDADGVVEYQEVANIISGGSGSSSVTLRMVPGANILATWNLYLVSSNADANDGVAKAAAPAAAYAYNPKIRLACGLTNGQTVDISAGGAIDVGGTPLTGANTTTPTTIIDVENQFAITFTRGTSVIDVTAPSLRTNFIAEGAILAGAFDTEAAASSGVVTVDNDTGGSVEDFVSLATYPATLDLTLGGTSNVYNGLDFAGNNVFIDSVGNPAVNSGVYYQFSSTTHIAQVASADLLANLTHNDTWSDDVYLGVNGAILTTQVWPLTATLNFTSVNINDVTATDSSFITWTINGYQGVIPYMTTHASYATYCIVNNTSSAVADVVLDVLSSENATPKTNLTCGQVPAQSTALITFAGNSVTNSKGGTAALGLADPERFSTRMTVTADQNLVYVNCVQADPAGAKRMVPVLTDEAAINWRQ